ncbi:MAG: hypothetical protein KGZ85_16035 [Ignavibacterium sp.]|nr:hypothetical protein [Ignavibacterium sp.]
MTDRKEYIEKLTEQLKDLEDRVQLFQVKAQTLKVDSKENLEKQLAEFRSKKDAAQDKIQDLKNSTESSWKELKSGSDKIWDEMKNTVDEVVSNIK